MAIDHDTTSELRSALLEMERRMIANPENYPRKSEGGPRCFDGIPYTIILDLLAMIGRQ